MSIVTEIPELDSFSKVEKIGGNEFDLGAQIGSGGRAKVYKGQELSEADRELAVKLITYQVSEHPSVVEKKYVAKLIEEFGMEANIWARFQQSPHVVTLFRVFKQLIPAGDGYLLAFGYLMELATDGDVFSFLGKRQGKPFFDKHELADEARFLRDIARGIEVGHTRDLIHGNIGPSNVLLFKQHGKLRPKVMDFGISQSTSQRRNDNSGTPEYMAPEQFLSPPKTTQKSDVYALGLLFYRILTGKTADEGKEKTQRNARLEHCRRPERPKAILKDIENIKDKSYKDLVSRMLEVDPEKRISLGTVLKLLDSILNTRIAVMETTGKISDIPLSNQHRWHPRVHYALDERVCYYFITGHLPLVDPVIIKNELIAKGIHGFAIYRVLGGVDYVLRVWADSIDQDKVEGVLKQFQAMNRGSYRAFIGACTSHFFSNPMGSHLEDEMQDPEEREACLAQLFDYLKALEAQPDGNHDSIAKDIVIAKLNQGEAGSKDEFPVRVFLTVQVAGKTTSVHIRQVANEFAYHYSRLERRAIIRDLSVHGGEGDGDQQLILQFRIRQFSDFAVVFKQFLDIAALVQTDTFTVSPRTFVEMTGLENAHNQEKLPESDDGGIAKFYADRKAALEALRD